MSRRTLLALAFSLLSLPAWAGTQIIEASGEGESVAAAKRQAQREAIEQAVGVFVTSTTKVENFQTVEDRIKTHAEGFIKSFQLIGEPRQTGNGTYVVRLRAEVSDETASILKNDLTAMGVLMEQVDHPKVLVYYDQEAFKDMPEFQDPGHLYLTTWAVDKLNGELMKHGFDYVSSKEVDEAKRDDRTLLDVKGGRDSAAKAIANKLKAQIYVKFRIHKENGDKVAISVEAVNPTTGTGLGSESGYSESLSRNPSITQAVQTAAAHAFNGVAGRSASSLLTQMMDGLKRQVARGTEYVMVFEGVADDDQVDALEDALKGLAERVRLIHVADDQAEFNIFTKQDHNDVRSALRKALKAAKITYQDTLNFRGNRLVVMLKK
jgi:hypothetical protein